MYIPGTRKSMNDLPKQTKEIKKELWQYQNAKKEWDRLNRKIEEIETQIMSIGVDYSKEKVQVSPISADKLANAIDMLSELREKASNEAYAMSCSMVETYGKIDKVKDPLQRQILQMRYIEAREWEDICYTLGYSWAHMHRMHRIALESLVRKDDKENNIKEMESE